MSRIRTQLLTGLLAIAALFQAHVAIAEMTPREVVDRFYHDWVAQINSPHPQNESTFMLQEKDRFDPSLLSLIMQTFKIDEHKEPRLSCLPCQAASREGGHGSTVGCIANQSFSQPGEAVLRTTFCGFTCCGCGFNVLRGSGVTITNLAGHVDGAYRT